MRQWVLVLSAWSLVTAVGARETQHVAIRLTWAAPSEIAFWLGCPAVRPRSDGGQQTILRPPVETAANPLPTGVETVIGYDLLNAMIAVGTPAGLARLRQIVAEMDKPERAVRLDAAVCHLRADLLPTGLVPAGGCRQVVLESEAARPLLAQARVARQDYPIARTGRTAKLLLGRCDTAELVAYTQAEVHLLPVGGAAAPKLRIALSLGGEELVAVAEHHGLPLDALVPPLVHLRTEVPVGKTLLVVPEPTSVPLVPPVAAAELARCAVIGPLFGRALPEGTVEGLLLTPRPAGGAAIEVRARIEFGQQLAGVTSLRMSREGSHAAMGSRSFCVELGHGGWRG